MEFDFIVLIFFPVSSHHAHYLLCGPVCHGEWHGTTCSSFSSPLGMHDAPFAGLHVLMSGLGEQRSLQQIGGRVGRALV